MKALVVERSLAKFAAARITSWIAPGKGGGHGPLSCQTVDAPELPRTDGSWHVIRPRLSGICGSDLATVEGMASRYFEPIVSFPFTPGHEVVADTDDGRRVVVVPVLHCAIRGIDPPCAQCAAGLTNRCERVAFGHLSPGLQTGFCSDTGGGWGEQMAVHSTQLVEVPAELTDEQAVMVEPTACAVHAATLYDGSTTVIIGAGTLGLLTLAAITERRGSHRTLGSTTGPVVVTARYPQQIAAARALGADRVVQGAELARTVRSMTASMAIGDQLTGGAPTVIDCVGSSDSLAQALQVVAPGGRVVMVGMPSNVSLDMTSLWHREVAVQGCYAYQRADFDTAIELSARLDLGRFVTETYPISAYAAAIEHASNAGRRGAVKIAFDLRGARRR